MSDETAPGLRIVRGHAEADEVAALVAVLSAKAREAADEPPARPSTWAAYWRSVRAPLPTGPDAWRSSAQPR